MKFIKMHLIENPKNEVTFKSQKENKCDNQFDTDMEKENIYKKHLATNSNTYCPYICIYI